LKASWYSIADDQLINGMIRTGQPKNNARYVLKRGLIRLSQRDIVGPLEPSEGRWVLFQGPGNYCPASLKIVN